MSAASYGRGERLLHRLALGGTWVPEMAFDLEKSVFLRRCTDASAEQHVFVCGLARAGTTLAMRALHASGEFVSLTYRDMPFVMAPNLWHRVSRRSHKQGDLAERAHRDGLLVDFDSPEALEEVFWRVHCGRDYITPEGLRPMQAEESVLEQFRSYVALILAKHGKRRYLSKNNNSILRIGSLVAAFPRAVVLVPFRHPVDQARSLLRQHESFKVLQAEDKYVRDYMGWLVHHEFGQDQRPFLWDEGVAVDAGPEELEYWLAQWVAAYGALLAQADRGEIDPVFFCYEAFCADPGRIWPRLLAVTGLSAATPLATEVKSPRPVQDATEHALTRRALALYEELKRQAAKRLGA